MDDILAVRSALAQLYQNVNAKFGLNYNYLIFSILEGESLLKMEIQCYLPEKFLAENERR